MTQEYKDLLLKDLYARLPYGIVIKEQCGDYININLYDAHFEHLIDRVSLGLDKLVLRSMSSMMEEEKKEYRKTQITKWIKSVDCTHGGYYEHRDTLKTFDWLNAHHFDYRGLIEKGLALEMPVEY